MKETLEEWKGGISLEGRKISNLRYTDDTILLAETMEEPFVLLQKVEAVSMKAGLR